MLQKHFWKLIGLVAVVLVGAAVVYGNHASNQANVGLTNEPNIKGNPDATVTLTEYADFQCPACKDFSAVVKEVLDTYGDGIRFEFKHFPLITIHQHAVAAGRAAEAAGQQGKFFEMHDKLFENQATWSPTANPQAFFLTYAEEIGLDMDKFRTHIRASELRDRVMAGYNEARDLGLTGTPTFYLNGQPMEISTYQDFADQIALAVTGVDPNAASSTDAVQTTAEEVQFGF